MSTRVVLVPFLVATALGLAGCAINPATGKRQIALIGEQQEIALGKSSDADVVAAYGLVDDPELQAYVSDIGLRLAADSERPNLPWKFQVVDDPTVNAFALPGGYIYVTRGILAHFQSEAELAGVLGHEIGHVTARHSVNQMSKQQLAGLGLGIGTIFAGEYGDLVQQLGGAGLGLAFLKFSRDDERQADDLGMRYMLRENYDPRAMASMFDTLGRIGAAAGARMPALYSTHPDPGNRRERADAVVAGLGRPLDDTIQNRAEYLDRIDGIVFGDDPRQGFFSGSTFHHPEMAFRITFPDGWRTRNTRSAVLATTAENDAVLQLTLAAEDRPDAAAEAFFAREGIRAGTSFASDLGGEPAVGREFTLTTGQGNLAGAIAWVDHGGRVIQLAGFAPQARWPDRAADARAAIATFRRETDPAVLAVEPARVEVFTLRADRTIEETVRIVGDVHTPLDRILILNGLDADRRLPKGTKVKIPQGGRLP